MSITTEKAALKRSEGNKGQIFFPDNLLENRTLDRKYQVFHFAFGGRDGKRIRGGTFHRASQQEQPQGFTGIEDKPCTGIIRGLRQFCQAQPPRSFRDEDPVQSVHPQEQRFSLADLQFEVGRVDIGPQSRRENV